MRLIFLALLGIAHSCLVDTPIAAIWHPVPWRATILIDDSFSTRERAWLVVGFDAWAQALPQDVVLRYGTVPHWKAETSSAPRDWIYVVRRWSSGSLNTTCEAAGKVACYVRSSRQIYLASEALEADDWAVVASHELGHTMGLDHCEDERTCAGKSVMSEHVNQMSRGPSNLDTQAFCRIHICAQ